MRGVFQPNVFQHNVFQIAFWRAHLKHDLDVYLATRLGAEGLIAVRLQPSAGLATRLGPEGLITVRPQPGIDLIAVREKSSGEVAVL